MKCKCGKEVAPERVKAIGEVRCMICPPPPLNVMIVEVSKSNSIVTSDPTALIGGIGKGRVGRSDPKGNGNYMRLEKKG